MDCTEDRHCPITGEPCREYFCINNRCENLIRVCDEPERWCISQTEGVVSTTGCVECTGNDHCGDSNECTQDRCTPDGECVHSAMQDFSSCESGLCLDGECVELNEPNEPCNKALCTDQPERIVPEVVNCSDLVDNRLDTQAVRVRTRYNQVTIDTIEILVGASWAMGRNTTFQLYLAVPYEDRVEYVNLPLVRDLDEARERAHMYLMIWNLEIPLEIPSNREVYFHTNYEIGDAVCVEGGGPFETHVAAFVGRAQAGGNEFKTVTCTSARWNECGLGSGEFNVVCQ